ncbi:methylmalonyl-CoA epimerase [Rhizobiaceae bacterium CRRU44]|uniref:methylmalonyl-CoA epimerase n=1 Tax=Ferranicluibacter rubi TaxID=2715133 RepID=A0AA44CDD4_9HYPH|nr:methylmalonyl-CoA epimerase [Ferranicluibacter rubi]NHT76862.1 methylmalonyl-CoA epimerase [Ferranicluibacter rubi]
MLGPINHIAIAVPDLNAAIALYEALGAQVSKPQDLPEHGVTVVFIELPNTKIELLYPLGENSPIASFLAKNPSGGIHHLCFEVSDIDGAGREMNDIGVRILGSGEPKIGAHGLPVLFAHPKDFFGTLVEFEEVARP